jgi:hypothetical protein
MLCPVVTDRMSTKYGDSLPGTQVVRVFCGNGVSTTTMEHRKEAVSMMSESQVKSFALSAFHRSKAALVTPSDIAFVKLTVTRFSLLHLSSDFCFSKVKCWVQGKSVCSKSNKKKKQPLADDVAENDTLVEWDKVASEAESDDDDDDHT